MSLPAWAGTSSGSCSTAFAEEAHAAEVAEPLLATFATAAVVDGVPADANLSLGIALGGRHDPAAGLLRNADIAIYLAKSEGKGRYELFRPSLNVPGGIPRAWDRNRA